MQFDLVLRTFADWLEREHVRYAVIGGLAVHAWGRARPTRDADFAVPLDDQERVVAFCESLGYRTVFRGKAFSNHEHLEAGWGHVDFMYVSGTTAASIFQAVVPKQMLPERLLPVASAEHLAMMKARAMKNFPHRALYEGEDVRVLLQVPGVDRQAIREYFERMGLLELFDAIEKAH